MTKYGLYRLAREKRIIYPLTLYFTTNYAIFSFPSCMFNTQNPTPTSCKVSLLTLKPLNHLLHKAWVDNMKNLYSCYFEGKSQRGTCSYRKGKVLPRFMQRGFENKRGFLHQSSENEREKSLKGSDNEGLCPETPFWE